MPPPTLETERLLLRLRRTEDAEAIARIDRDPEVYRYSEVRASAAAPPAKSALRLALREAFASEALAAFWTIARKDDRHVIGIVGLAHEAPPILNFQSPPDTWFLSYRLAREAWGQGYATEAAAAAIDYGFAALGAREIVAFTHAANARSRRVLEKLGMTATGMMLARSPGGADAGQLYLALRAGRRTAAPSSRTRRAPIVERG